MTISICCLLIIGVLVGQRAAGFSITRHNDAIISRQIIDHQLGSSRSKAANSFPSFEMMSTIDDDDKDLSTSDELFSSFKSGMSFVNTKYLDTWGEVWKTGKYMIPLAAFFFLGVAVYPGTTMNVVSEEIRSMLERVLMLFHSTPVRLILATLRLPYMIVRGIINGSLRSLSDVTAIMERISHWVISTPKASSLSYVTPASVWFHFHVIVVAPIMEELVFRWGLWRLWKSHYRMMGMGTNCNLLSTPIQMGLFLIG